MLRKSVPNSSVARLCRKNSMPPVASSWLIGAEPRIGAMIEEMHEDAEHRDAEDRGERRRGAAASRRQLWSQ